jgi:hypothetical protein
MRSLLTLATLVALVPSAALEAQSIIGFGAGIRSSSLNFDPSDQGAFDGSRTGISVSGFVGIPLSETFRIQPGLGYAQRGGGESEQGVDVTLNLDYIEIPVMGVFSVPSEGPVGVHVFGGPMFAFEVGCSLSGKEGGISVDLDCESQGSDIRTKSFELGVALGAAVSYATSETMSIFGSAHYGLGLTDINDDPDSDGRETVKHRGLAVTVGLAFRRGN